MLKESLFLVIGGVSLFLYGIYLLSNGLQKASGNLFRRALESITKNPINGVILGTIITTVIQSSSAVSVMVVSFVNAGLLNLKQAISVILGSHIGTTTTAWIVASFASFNLLNLVLPAMGFGVTLMFFTQTKRLKLIGEIFFGFGLLFLGLDFMKEAGTPLEQSSTIKELIAKVHQYPLIGVLIGAVFTTIVQGSAATIAMTQTMAFNGLINFDFSLAIVLGANIGTTVTAQIGSFGANVNARRAALAHTLINIFGTLYFSIFFLMGTYQYVTDLVVPGSLSKETIMIHIAGAHTIFNIINSIIFLPLIGVLSKLCHRLISSKKENTKKITLYLNPKFLATPELALEQVKREIIHMAKISNKAFQIAFENLIIKGDSHLSSKVTKLENTADLLQGEIIQYLIELQKRALLEEEAQQIPCFIHTINDLEKIADYSEDIMYLTIQKKDTKIIFRAETIFELKKMYHEINNLFSFIIESVYTSQKNIISKSFEVVNRIRDFKDLFKQNYLSAKEPIIQKQIKITILLDLLVAFDKITSHLKNIAETVENDYRWRADKREK